MIVPIILQEGMSHVPAAVHRITGFVVLYPMLQLTLALAPNVVFCKSWGITFPLSIIGTALQSVKKAMLGKWFFEIFI